MTDDVRTALRALATDADTSNPRDTVAEATAALDDVRDTAAFLDDDGVDRLRNAIETAARRGDDAVARRGRDALATIEDCRRAAADHFRHARGTVLRGGALRSRR